MPYPKGIGKSPGSGRKPGTRNKVTYEVQAFARSIVEDPQVQTMILQQAREGLLAPVLLQTLFHYAYGRPVDKVELSGNAEKPVCVTIRRAY